MNSVDGRGYSQESPTTEANSIQTLSKLWTKKYVQKVIEPEEVWEVSSKEMRTITTQRLLQSLRSTSAQAWTKTETLLSQEVMRHGINSKLIDPWEIATRTIELYPQYRSYSGTLGSPKVKISSVRDVEMFQIYLWVCLLENSMAVIQNELFPLCVMLYPTLNVRWELVRQMLHLMGIELRGRLEPQQVSLFMPYFQALWEMFSPEVFPDSLEKEGLDNSAGRRCG